MAATSEVFASERGFARSRATQGAVGASATSLEDIGKAHTQLVATFKSGRTKTYEWRVRQLEGIRRFMVDHKEQIVDALRSDMGRPRFETFVMDYVSVVQEVDHILGNLKSWMQPQAVTTPFLAKPGHSMVIREPKGVILLLSPWNFPFMLAGIGMAPIVAAGNCCLLKPSEMTPQSEELLKNVLPKYVDPDAIRVVTGGVPEATAVLKLRWDHIMYTGNGDVGRIVARAAAEHLTPTTLELGGKSPTVVLPGANLQVCAKRVLAAKCANAGQVCVSPDYALVHESLEEPLLLEMQRVLKTWFGDDASTSDSFSRIINDAHFRRVRNLIDSADGEVLPQQGKPDQASRFIPPTLIRGPTQRTAVMQEEIFGPVLPIIKMRSVEEMIEYINCGEKPLALYVFGPEAECKKVIVATSSGGVCVNDTLLHAGSPFLPFGGVGASGTGKYHGKWGFDEFSHTRGVMFRATWIDPPQRYPPFDDSAIGLFEKIMIGPIIPPGLRKAMTALGAAFMVAAPFVFFRALWSRL